MEASFWRRLWTCRQTEYWMNEWITNYIDCEIHFQVWCKSFLLCACLFSSNINVMSGINRGRIYSNTASYLHGDAVNISFHCYHYKISSKKTLIFCSPRSRLALGPTQPSLQCILAAPFTDMQELGHEELMITHLSCLKRRPENVAQLRAHIVKLCRTLSEDLCWKVVMNARVRLQEVVRQNGGHIEHVLH